MESKQVTLLITSWYLDRFTDFNRLLVTASENTHKVTLMIRVIMWQYNSGNFTGECKCNVMSCVLTFHWDTQVSCGDDVVLLIGAGIISDKRVHICKSVESRQLAV